MVGVGRARRGRGRPGRRARLRRRLLRRRALPARAAPHRLTRARSSRSSTRPPGCCAPAARWSRSSPACGIRSARAWRSPTAPGSARRFTARPTTSRSRRARCAAKRAPPASSPSCTRSPIGWRRLPPPAQRALHRLDPLGSRPRVAPLRSHADADRPPVLEQLHAEPALVEGLADGSPALALVEAPRSALANGGEQSHRRESRGSPASHTIRVCSSAASPVPQNAGRTKSCQR